MRCLVPVASLWLALSAASTLGAETVPAFDSGRYSQAVTDCDRLAGQVGFVKWTLDGTFATCPVRQDLAELRGFLTAARQQAADDFYQGLLIDMLERDAGVQRP